MPTYGLYLSTLVHEFIGIYVRKLSILVLVGSLLFVMVYALFFNNEYEYFDFNNGLLYIAFWAVLLTSAVKIVHKSPDSFLKSNSKETKSKKEE